MARRRTRRDPNLTAATALVDLEYAPQFAAVRDAYGKATQQYHRDRIAAREMARGVQGYARKVEPDVKKTYSTAARGLEATNAETDAAIKAFNPGQTPYGSVISAMIERERGAARNRISAERASALNDLKQRGVEAEAGRALGYTMARQTLNQNRKELTQKLADLTGMKSSALTLQLSKLQAAEADEKAEAARERAKTRAAANRRITSGPFKGLTQGEVDAMSTDAAVEYANESGGGGQGKSNRRTAEAQERISDRVAHAVNVAKTYRGKFARPQLAQTMLKGQIAGTDPSLINKANPTGAYPAIPRFDQFVASLALDMAYDGHVSRANARKLHKLGYKVSDIEGAVSFRDWLKTPQGQQWQDARGGRSGVGGAWARP